MIVSSEIQAQNEDFLVDFFQISETVKFCFCTIWGI